MKVTVAVHGRFHGFDLAGQLHRRGMLARLVTTYPAFLVRRFLPADVSLATAPWLEAERRLLSRLPFAGRPDWRIASRFGRFAADRLGECDLLVGWSGASLEAAAEARRRGIRVVVERGSTHMEHQCEVLAEAHARWNVPWTSTDPRLVERELAEYAAADLIALGSRHAAETFRARGVSAEKLMVNPYGVDLGRFRVGERRERRDGPPRLLFVGSVGVRKGVPELLAAFARLRRPVELHLVGPVEPGFAAVLNRLAGDGVVVRGPLPGGDLPAEYARADAFVLPSIEEGFGMVILQAMASGLPVVASSATGLPDADPDGRTGLVVAPGDIDGLWRALETVLADEVQSRSMGAAARRMVEEGWSWDDYGRRAAEAYQRLLDGTVLDHSAPLP